MSICKKYEILIRGVQKKIIKLRISILKRHTIFNYNLEYIRFYYTQIHCYGPVNKGKISYTYIFLQ